MPETKVKSLRSGKIYTVYGLSGGLFLLWKDGWYYEPIEFYVPVKES